MVIAVILVGVFGCSPTTSTSIPEEIMTAYINKINNLNFDNLGETIYYKGENYDTILDSYHNYNSLSLTSADKTFEEDNLLVCNVMVEGNLVSEGVSTQVKYNYDVYLIEQNDAWKLLTPLDIATGNDNNYQIDEKNQILTNGTDGDVNLVCYWGNDLSNFEMPNTITSIDGCFFVPTNEITEDYIKSYSPNVTTITIPANVTSIKCNKSNESIFKDCNNLTTVNFEANSQLTTIGDYAFYNCDLVTITIPANVYYIGESAFSCSSGVIIIIDVDGSCTFEVCNSLTTVNFEKNSQLTTIGNYAFKDCGLTSITIPSSVTTIGDCAFYNCSRLTTINFESGGKLTTIGSKAFYCCGLTSITIPSSVTTIGDSAFCDCNSLISIEVDEANLYYKNDSAKEVLLSKDETELIQYAIGNTNESYTVSLTVTTISDYAFYDCVNLISITIPSSVTTIGSYAFEYCNSLISITIPSSVTTIGDCAFYRCPNLVTLNFESDGQLTTIGEQAFYCCGLISITIPSSITTIGCGAFACCNSLVSIEVDEANLYYKNDNAKEVLLSKDGTTLVQYAIGNTDECYTVSSTVTIIGDYAFDGSGLIMINFEENSQLRTIGESAFASCHHLTTINFEEDSQLTTIGSKAFYCCNNLTSITIPSSAITIGNSAFECCDSLTTVNFESDSKLTTIGSSAFEYCNSLISITIPSSVTVINWGVFYSCDSLENITLNSENLIAYSNLILYDCSKLQAIYVPSDLLNEYKIASGWSAFADLFVAIG
jgi:hypothetical protein